MNIIDLLLPQNILVEKSPPIDMKDTPINEEDLMPMWEAALNRTDYYSMKNLSERNILTSAIIKPRNDSTEIPVHIKVIGRQTNGSFRCHIGTSKASRPIESSELCNQMKLMVVFFRFEHIRSQLVSPEFIFFPTWLLHIFRYTRHGNFPGRTDVRFLENADMAKEDHIYRLNHVLNTLFRFNIHNFDPCKMRSAIELANFLFTETGSDYEKLPRPIFANEHAVSSIYHQVAEQPAMYSQLLLRLYSPRPVKSKPMCHNCNTKPASRRNLCVACYRYQLKHNKPRPLRLIVANRPGPRIPHRQQEQQQQQQQQQQHQGQVNGKLKPIDFYSQKAKAADLKICANCDVRETHQWYRNLCGEGKWCETCKSYYLRHTKVRPPELFVKAAKRKVDVRALVIRQTWSWDDIPAETIALASNINSYINGSNSNMSSPTTSTASSSYSYPSTPPSISSVSANYSYYQQQQQQQQRRPSFYSSNSSSPTTSTW